ncbi:arylsulfatase B-like [Pomacea canaliculata]|uniref:arylsulfatase B-like n=1 Tax=Pomacea canaliculata TaxID=400727 RepID=UPI000D72DFF5|nr:arylsulfatase B-like [Pomacea canaliculata]
MGIHDDGFEGLMNASVQLHKKMLLQTLKEYNYSTHMVGKWHLGFCRREMTPLGRGFDTFYGMYNGATDHYTHTTGSNGYDLTIWEGGTKVTSFLYSKTLLKGNRVYNGIAHATDWYPTLERVAGGNGTIEGIDGLNLWDSISKNRESPRQEFVYDLSDITNRSTMRYKNYKLTWNRPGAPDLSGWYYPPLGVEQPPTPKYSSKVYTLFDLATDPTATTDISNRSDVRSVFTYMKKKLYELRLNMPPSMLPTRVNAGKPENWGGAWTTGWC